MAEQDRDREEQQAIDEADIEARTQQQSAPEPENREWWRGDGGSGETT